MNPTGARVEPGSIVDLDAVMGVMEASFDPEYGEAWTAPQCAGLLPLPGVWLSLVRTGDAVVGFTLSRIVLQEAELLLLAVDPSAQRTGIGQMLVDDFIDVATMRGATDLHLEVREGNHAVKLYTKAGFREVGRRLAYYRGQGGQLRDALTLAKKLDIRP